MGFCLREHSIFWKTHCILESEAHLQAVFEECSKLTFLFGPSLKERVRCYLKPAVDHFRRNLQTTMKDCLAVFEAAQLFVPDFVVAKGLDWFTADLIKEKMSKIKTFTEAFVDQLVQQRLEYFNKATSVARGETGSAARFLEFFFLFKNYEPISHWARGARVVALFQPSSAAMERVFSIVSRFTDQQSSMKEDYMQLVCMLRYNYRLENHFRTQFSQ